MLLLFKGGGLDDTIEKQLDKKTDSFISRITFAR